LSCQEQGYLSYKFQLVGFATKVAINDQARMCGNVMPSCMAELYQQKHLS